MSGAQSPKPDHLMLAGRERPSRLADVLPPPVHRYEFWLTVVLAVLVTILHGWMERDHVLDEHSPFYLFPTTLYLVPIIYATVTFGVYGALATGVLAVVLTLPNLWLWHPGSSSFGELAQVAWIVLVGGFVGVRVDRERAARAQAERSRDRVRASEERYRSVLENITDPLLVLDHERRVMTANEAAARLVGLPLGELVGLHLTGPIASTILRALPDLEPGGDPIRRRLLSSGRWYDISALEIEVDGHGQGLQLLLIDVTEQQDRMTQLEALTRETITAREEERLRIARDLHDGPLQSVIAVHLSLDTLIDEQPTDPESSLSRAQTLAQDAAEQLRRASRELRPAVLDDLGTLPALKTEATAFSRRTGIPVDVDAVGDAALTRLSPEREIAVLRICQEALRNVERHARASSVTIRLDIATNEDFRLRIEDDGVGTEIALDHSALAARGHLGLIGMEERALMVGGTLSIERLARSGTRVEVRLPRWQETSGGELQAH